MEKGTLLKRSQFNYTAKDDEGNIIICNFAKGVSSFCKILASDYNAYKTLIDNNAVEFNQGKDYIVKLVEKGILVPKDYDEMMTVNSLYWEAVMDNEVRIIIMPTEQCNFRCVYCYESYQKDEMTKKDQISLLKFIQRTINNTTKLHISWFGGEPLEAVDIVRHIMDNVNRMSKKKNIQVISDMTTNGYNLNAETFDSLYDRNVRIYQITLDGLEDQHNKQRVLKNGDSTFQQIVDNLLFIKNNYEKYKYVSISVRVNISREILENLPAFIEFYRDNLGNDRRFSLALTPINDMGGTSVKRIKSQFVKTSEIYAELNKMDLYNDTSIQISNILRAFSPTDSLCYASKKNTYVIGSDLSIYKCTVHFDMKENRIGKILSNGEPDIDEFYSQKWYVNLKYKEICKTCFMLPCCFGGGCPHKRNFCEDYAGKCVLPTWKHELKNAIKYLSSRSNIEIIRINN